MDLTFGRVCSRSAESMQASLNRRLHFSALVSAEAHVVIEDVSVSCIQFLQERTSWAFACSEYGVWPDIVRKDSQ